MKMLGILIKNEIIKIFRKVSVIVLIAVLAAVTIVFSLIDSDDFNLFGSSYSLADMKENYTYNYYDDSEYNGSNDSNEKKAFLTELNSMYAEAFDRAIAAGVEKSSDWRMSEFYSIINSYESKLAIKLRLDGKLPDSMSNYVDKDITDSELKENLKAIEDAEAKSWKTIEDNDYTSVYAAELLNLEGTSGTAQDFLSGLRGSLNGEESEILDRISSAFTKTYTDAEATLKLAVSEKYIYGSVEQKEAVSAYSAAYSALSETMPDKSGFEESVQLIGSYTYTYNSGKSVKLKTYAEYLNCVYENVTEKSESVRVARYALENGIAEISCADSTRNNLLPITSLFSLFAFFGLFIACGSVSREFSKKTINMLLIRPISRSKVLLSKYLSCIIVALGTTLGCVLVSILFSGIRYGFADLFIPYLTVSGGEIVKYPFLLWFIGKMLIACLGVAFLTTVSFFFSTVTKNTAVSVIITVVVYYASSIASSILPYIASAVHYYLPFIYVSMWDIVFDGMTKLSASENLFGGYGSVYSDLLYGSCILLLLGAVMYFTADYVFRKRDVK